MAAKEKKKKVTEGVKIVSVHLPISLYDTLKEIGRVNAMSVHGLVREGAMLAMYRYTEPIEGGGK